MARPTDYDPSICQEVVEYGRQGKSRTWITAKLGIVKDTLYRWEKIHPEFSDALTRAKLLEQMWWEDKGQDALDKREFQSSVWSRSMAARFPDEWRDKIAHVGDKNDDAIQQTVTLDADAFTRRILSANARATIDCGTGEPARTDEG